ncbi:unnamed protein product [Fraxinus pennsylvanica]|uniref:Uncharacterized protein n=1 Tax=Fraxinus pennsylvanica TaxID=56036 RepID=A0AAD1ZW93_9LAMI|nr:unnamed protein product [Fraxinus pennsylvanica]
MSILLNHKYEIIFWQLESEDFQRLVNRRWEREQGRKDVTEDMSEDLSEGEKGDGLGELGVDSAQKKLQRNFSNIEVWSDNKKEKKLYIVLIRYNQSSIEYSGNQAREFFKAIERENEVRTEYSQGSDIYLSLEDLKLGSKGNLEELNPGCRVQLTLGEPGLSRFSYKAVLLDAQKDSGPFTYHCGVFLVPKTRAREWLFSSEEGQWLVVESSKAARLVMILLDSSNSNGSMDDIQKDLSPLVKQLSPGDCDNGAQIPFMTASDGIKQRSIVHKATSTLTGSIIVDDVIYEKLDNDLSRRIPFNDVMFRRLIFQRSEGLVQSEALLLREGSIETQIDIEKRRTHSTSKSKRKGIQKRVGSREVESLTSKNNLKVDHNYLASSYHNGIISGLMLISSYLEKVSSAHGTVKAIVIGLGAGLLPKFLHKCLPFLEIEVKFYVRSVDDISPAPQSVPEDGTFENILNTRNQI